jgi:hypothetical protein
MIYDNCYSSTINWSISIEMLDILLTLFAVLALVVDCFFFVPLPTVFFFFVTALLIITVSSASYKFSFGSCMLLFSNGDTAII